MMDSRYLSRLTLLQLILSVMLIAGILSNWLEPSVDSVESVTAEAQIKEVVMPVIPADGRGHANKDAADAELYYLFSASRSVLPVEDARPAAPVIAKPSPPSVSDWILTGTIISDDKQIALFQSRRDNTSVALENGMSLNGWKIQQVTSLGVVLLWDDQHQELFIRQHDKPGEPHRSLYTRLNE